METRNGRWPASRVVHLTGGIRAINIDGPQVRIEPKTLQGTRTHFDTRSYGSIITDLKKLGFLVIGVDFFTSMAELKDEILPDWRVFNKTPTTAWPSEETAQVWSNIARSAFEQKEGHTWDLASRIRHQLRVCSWRIRQLSEAYHQQLMARSLKNDVVLGQRYDDEFTWNTYLAVQSYLVDACILRDYLSEFAAAFVFQEKYGLDDFRVSSIGGLIRDILRRKDVNDTLAEYFRQATRGDGWLKVLGEYRDLVVHSAPLAHAESRLFAVISGIESNSEDTIPFIEIPLPKNPDSISAKRASRKHFRDFESQFNRYIEALRKSEQVVDALTYIVKTHGKLAALAGSLSKKCPIAIQDHALTDRHFIGPISVTRE